MRWILTLVLAWVAHSQMPGAGISKYTVASSNPILGMEFLLAFFPVSVASDECTDNVCNCTWRGVHSEVVQGRVTLAGAPFGVHLTDTAKWTTNGLSVAQVESQFASKLGDMSAFDAFMDYSLGLCMVSETFDSTLANLTAAGHAYLPVAWESSSSEASGDWYSAFVHVPESQMILELITDSSALLSSSSSSSSLRRLETRLSPAQVARCQSSFDNGGLPLVSTVSRAASNVTEVQAFYEDGMNVSFVWGLDDDDGTSVATRCFQWMGSEVDVCFRQRLAAATAGDFSVAEFETMLKTVHNTILAKNPNCGMDKWADNHYAIDATLNANWIVDFLKANTEQRYICNGQELHYVFDPTGWAVQLDLNFSRTAPGCSWRDWDASLEPDFSCWGGVCEASMDEAVPTQFLALLAVVPGARFVSRGLASAAVFVALVAAFATHKRSQSGRGKASYAALR